MQANSKVFDPEMVVAMRSAVVSAWRSLPPARRMLVSESLIAEAIVQLAGDGEIDPVRLRGRALAAIGAEETGSPRSWREVDPALIEEARRLKEDLILATKRARMAGSDDPRLPLDAWTRKRATEAGRKIVAMKSRLSQIEAAVSPNFFVASANQKSHRELG